MSLETISAKDMVNYIGREDIQVIDIREPVFYQREHIPTAINIPYNQFENRLNSIPTCKTLLIYCERGGISLLLCKKLSNAGYCVKNLYGGINAYRDFMRCHHLQG